MLPERAPSEGPGEGRLDDLLCSCNARSPKALAWPNGTSRRVSRWAGEKATRSKGQYGRTSGRRAMGWLIFGPLDPEHEHFQ